ncbi:MAG: hypothetical protein WC821_02680 [archaeon]|jgi:hypothetical protein
MPKINEMESANRSASVLRSRSKKLLVSALALKRALDEKIKRGKTIKFVKKLRIKR